MAIATMRLELTPEEFIHIRNAVARYSMMRQQCCTEILQKDYTRPDGSKPTAETIALTLELTKQVEALSKRLYNIQEDMKNETSS